MKIGQAVMLICREEGMPPIGSVGHIVSDINEDSEHDVEIESYPCPAGPDPSWIVPVAWLIPLGDNFIPDFEMEKCCEE